MPIDTSSEVWQGAERDEPPLRERVLSFLREHPDRAYHLRELADEILDTDWGTEYYPEKVDPPEDDYESGRDAGDVIMDSIENVSLLAQLRGLEREGMVEVRSVPTEETDIPYDWESVKHYSAAD